MSAPATPRSVPASVLPPHTAEERVRSLLLLNEAARTLNSILELEPLLDKIVNEVTDAFGCSLSGIALKDPDTGDMITAAVQGGVEPKGVRYRTGLDGIIGQVAATGTLYYAPDVRVDPHYKMCALETRSEVDIPLKVGSELIGVFSAQHAEVDAFCPEQIQVLQVLAEHIAIAVQNARRFQREREERQQLYWQQQEAAAIQQALFPKASPLIPGLQVEGMCITAHAVGGDWFDYIALTDGRWAFVLADVAGKGMPAALLMTSSRGILRSLVETTPSPAPLLNRLNRILYRDFPPEKFVTMVYAVFDPADRTLTFASAGHPAPIMTNERDTQLLEKASGLPLGIADWEYEECTVTLEQDARVLLYSDGITEAENDAGEQFGTERLVEQANQYSMCVETVLESVSRFTRFRPLADDATLILLRSKA
ncbi:MAG TPA: GAF domain-containing SpoIIE family protein phosphatase [Terriglobales bacterium]|nr:GAF domain-containing SpoIIE family protein phosphatase [Terriglobales bacterium]